eukprot:COSAG06_NODE_3773_length_4920_cov_2.695499_2_plen_107_part_00
MKWQGRAQQSFYVQVLHTTPLRTALFFYSNFLSFACLSFAAASAPSAVPAKLMIPAINSAISPSQLQLLISSPGRLAANALAITLCAVLLPASVAIRPHTRRLHAT